MDDFKIFLTLNGDNHVMGATNASNRDPKKLDYVLVDGDYESLHPLMDSNYQPRYKLSNGQIVLRTEQEKAPAILELKKSRIRAQRNELLKQCDFSVLSDVPFSAEQKQEVLDYRQALRDMMENLDVNNVSFPQKPSFL